MTTRNSNSATANTGSNGAATLLAATPASAGCVRSRGEAAMPRQSQPSSTAAAIYHRCECCLIWPVFTRLLWNIAFMALASEAACIVAMYQEWPRILIFLLFSAVVTCLMAILVLLFATVTQRSRAMLSTILLPRKKWEEHVAQRKCDSNATLDL